MRLFSALNFESPKKPLSNGLSALKSPGGISVKSPAALLKPDAKPNLGPTSPKPLVFKVNKDQSMLQRLNSSDIVFLENSKILDSKT